MDSLPLFSSGGRGFEACAQAPDLCAMRSRDRHSGSGAVLYAHTDPAGDDLF